MLLGIIIKKISPFNHVLQGLHPECDLPCPSECLTDKWAVWDPAAGQYEIHDGVKIECTGNLYTKVMIYIGSIFD